MPQDSNADADVKAIEAIIARQFASLNWTPTSSGDWQAFEAGFHPTASLYPAARPTQRQTVEAFIERMKELAGTTMRTFGERVLGTQVHVFGNIAVALAGCEITENGARVSRGVEMMLLAKSEDAWQIVAQAWDTESPFKPMPAPLQVTSVNS